MLKILISLEAILCLITVSIGVQHQLICCKLERKDSVMYPTAFVVLHVQATYKLNHPCTSGCLGASQVYGPNTHPSKWLP